MMEPKRNYKRVNLIWIMVVQYLTLIASVESQFYTDYPDGGGGGGFHLPPFDIPVVYKHNSLPAAYPVATTIYSVALMKAIEAMPGKKTVPLYIVPEDSLQVSPNKPFRIKRSVPGPDGLRVNIKYPEFFGLTDGYHIPAVEIPLNKPMVVRQIEVNVLAPSGFMVPYQGEDRDRDWPYPMNTGCLIAAIPRNTYVSEDNPITIRKLYAVPSLPEYPTYRPAFDRQNHPQYYGHSDPAGPVNEVLANFFPANRAAPQPPQSHPHAVHHTPPQGHPHAVHHTPPPIYIANYPPKPKTEPPPVFELVPVTPKSSRRNGKKRKNEKRKGDYSDEDSSDEEDEEKDSQEESDEDKDDDRRSNNKKCSKNSRRRNCRKKTTTTTSTTTTTTPTTTTTTRPTTTTTTPTTTTTATTTTASTTTAAASSIQDIIAAFSSYRQRDEERRSRLSASYRDDDRDIDRERERPNRNQAPYRDEDRFERERIRSGNSASLRDDRDNRGGDSGTFRETPGSRDDPRGDEDRLSQERTRSRPSRDREGDRERERENRESRRSQVTTDSPSSSTIAGLRQQMIQRQISQLQRLLTSLNLSKDSNDENLAK